LDNGGNTVLDPPNERNSGDHAEDGQQEILAYEVGEGAWWEQ
jgi:hypothetical protein